MREAVRISLADGNVLVRMAIFWLQIYHPVFQIIFQVDIILNIPARSEIFWLQIYNPVFQIIFQVDIILNITARS